MQGMTDEQVLGFNKGIIEEFRANEGKCGGVFEGNPLLLLTMTGARSGRELTSPLTYHANDGNYIVMASAGGDPKPPAWYFNLTANPDVTVEVGAERFDATAVEAQGDERASLYASMVEELPRFAEYQEAVERQIPVFKLVRK